MKLLQINTLLNAGSTGRISEQIGAAAAGRGHRSLIAYGRPGGASRSRTYRVGGQADMLLHGLESLLFDGHGLGSRAATRRLVHWLETEGPDLVGLHNIHGYYLNFPILFDALQRAGMPVVWTLHDCWPLTGHCCHFDRFNCTKWQTRCSNCPMTGYYPRSLRDLSRRNHRLKEATFTALSELIIVTPSRWLKGIVERSFLSRCRVEVIHNGVDLDVFVPASKQEDEILVLGVANGWSSSKGLGEFARIRERLPTRYRVVLVGVTRAQMRSLPDGVEGVERTERVEDLARWYQRATVYVNPTYFDNFPTTNLEALACGVPVVTYDSGGSPEAVDDSTGRVVARGDVDSLTGAIMGLVDARSRDASARCRARAEQRFNQVERFADYVDLYESLLRDRVH